MLRRITITRATPIVLALMFLFIIAGAAGAATKESPADFYKGKRAIFMCKGRPGGGEFLMIQTLLPYLSKATGATWVMNNIATGIGVEGFNYVWQAKPDGLTIGGGTFSMFGSLDLFKEPGSLTKMDQVNYLIGVGKDVDVFWVKADGPYKTVDALKAGKNIKFAAGAPMDIRSVELYQTCAALNLDAKVATGFSTNESGLAVIRGESAGYVSVPGTYLRGVADGWKALFALDTVRIPALPDVPALPEVAKLDKENADFMRLKANLHSGIFVYTIPGVPADRVEYLRRVFEQITKQPEFQADAQKMLGYKNVEYPSGTDLEKAAKELKANQQLFLDTVNRLAKRYRT